MSVVRVSTVSLLKASQILDLFPEASKAVSDQDWIDMQIEIAQAIDAEREKRGKVIRWFWEKLREARDAGA